MKIRLFINGNIASGDLLELEKSQKHYLKTVLRAKTGKVVYAFNAECGEFACEYVEHGLLQVGAQTIKPAPEPKLTLLFAPIKFGKIDFMVQKATELGVTEIQPVKTRFTSVTRINYERLSANAREAAEQTGRITFPEISEMQALEKVVEGWDESQKIIFCDESLADGGQGEPIRDVLQKFSASQQDFAILIGPEGGFAPDEAEFLRSKNFIHPASMGKRILRAETAVVAGLGAFQAIRGDWS